MALDVTKGLPSFSEMYQAYKTKGGLGQALQGGIDTYNSVSKSAANEKKDLSEADKNAAEAKYYLNKANTPPEKMVPVSSVPQAVQASVLPYANEQGLIPLSVAQMASGTNKQSTDADNKDRELKAREAALAETEKHNREKAALQEELNRTRQELGNNQQELSAAHTVADIAAKGDEPSLLNRGVSFVKEATGHQPTESVLNERMKDAALKKLQERGGIIPGATPAPLASPAPSPAPKPLVGKVLDVDGSPASEAAYNALPKGAKYTYQGKSYTKQ